MCLKKIGNGKTTETTKKTKKKTGSNPIDYQNKKWRRKRVGKKKGKKGKGKDAK